MKKLNLSFALVLFVAGVLFTSCSEDKKDEPMPEPILTLPSPVYGTVTDVDGNTYPTITIGTQVWMAENLKTTKYNDGTAILLDTTTVKDPSNSSVLGDPAAYCWYNNDSITYSNSKYGALYNFNAEKTGKLAPIGWHVSTSEDWDELEDYLELYGYSFSFSNYNIAKALAASTDWNLSTEAFSIGNDLSTNNSSGLNLLPAGYKAYSLSSSSFFYEFANVGNSTELITTDSDSSIIASSIGFSTDYTDDNSDWIVVAFSVRCVKD